MNELKKKNNAKWKHTFMVLGAEIFHVNFNLKSYGYIHTLFIYITIERR